jgi:hypothetical protein
MFGPAPTPAPVAVSEPDAVPFDFADTRIPDAARDRLTTIAALLDDLMEAAAQSPAAAAGLAEATRIRDVYLPELMHSYFAIPAKHRAEIFRETGRSASFLLGERLDKLIARLRETSRLIAQSPLDDFNQKLGFLDSRFDDPDDYFGLKGR